MPETRSTALAALLSLCIGSAVAAAPTWEPARTWAFVVGVLKWQSKDFERFVPKGRHDRELVALLKKRGVPADRIVFLQDKAAKLAAIRKKLDEMLARTRPGDTFVFYYAGHGFEGEGSDGVFLANYDAVDEPETWWPIGEIVRTVEAKFQGDRALLLVDCCHSGKLADIAAALPKPRVPAAVLTAVVAENSSTGDWTFTQSLVDGFSGSPLADRDRDGALTVGELSDHAAAEMAIFEKQVSRTELTGGFPRGFVLGPVDATRRPERWGERVRVKYEGKWWNARLMAVEGKKARVRWTTIGYDRAKDEEWVPLKTVETLAPKGYAVGARVSVSWTNKKGKVAWYPAVVLAEQGGMHRVHYAGWDAKYDEWVGPERVK